MNDYIFKSQARSEQIISTEGFYDRESNGLLEPFISFDELLRLYYSNVYHRRAIRIKAGILSQIEVKESGLKKFLPPNMSEKSFLFSLALNLEIFGNAPIEKAGKGSFFFYNLPPHEWRLNRDGEHFQIDSQGGKKPLVCEYIKYHSPASRFYGEPDYLSAILAISVNNKADEYNDAFFENGARPDLAIIHKNSAPTEQQVQNYKTFFSNNFKGAGNAHRTLLAYCESHGEKEADIRFESLGGVSDLSFRALKEVARDEIAVAHGVPPRLLGIMNAGGLGGGGELIGQLHQFNEIEIKPKIELIEGFFSSLNINVVLKPLDVTNFKDDGEIVGMLVEKGIISIDEARSILGWQKNL